MTRGPLPQWDPVGGYGSGVYEAKGPHGVVWLLRLVEQPGDGDPLPPGYRLAPRDDQSNPAFIIREHGLYHALDAAGMQIAADAVRDDPDGARRQLGLDGG
ncbi:hypothetical protein ACIOC2_01410 [Streptomyces sp. NPDC088337]|uniref:hypothetical protein n=1 Tax=unclassified Streptomyces TaxID=2593676 RepID=UPI0037F1475A